jgi:hypothetical protein
MLSIDEIYVANNQDGYALLRVNNSEDLQYERIFSVLL